MFPTPPTQFSYKLKHSDIKSVSLLGLQNPGSSLRTFLPGHSALLSGQVMHSFAFYTNEYFPGKHERQRPVFVDISSPGVQLQNRILN